MLLLPSQWLGAARQWLLVLKDCLLRRPSPGSEGQDVPDKRSQKAQGPLQPTARNSRCRAARMSAEVMEADDDEPTLYPEAVGKETWVTCVSALEQQPHYPRITETGRLGVSIWGR